MNKRYLLAISSIVCSIVLLMTGPPAMAITSEALNAITNNTPFYDPNASADACSASTDSSTGADLVGNDNEEKIFNYFTGKGLSAIAAAGIDGNFGQESHWNPDDGGGYLAQWGGGRLTNLIAFAQQQNQPVTDLGVQLDFVWHELNSSYPTVLAAIKIDTTVAQATIDFMGPTILPDGSAVGGYEDPGIPDESNRIAYAQAAYQLYGGTAVTASALASTVAGSNCSSVTGDGVNTKFVDGFTFYDQCDPSWGTTSYGDANICAAGCGPTSMAMIVTTLTKQQVTPPTIAAYADSHGLYVDGEGSSWSISPDIAALYNLKATAIGASVTAIDTVLQAGGLVIAAGTGAVPFTSEGHFIVIRGVAPDGKWLIGDPDASHVGANSAEWDPSQLVLEMSGGSVYAISNE